MTFGAQEAILVIDLSQSIQALSIVDGLSAGGTLRIDTRLGEGRRGF